MPWRSVSTGNGLRWPEEAGVWPKGCGLRTSGRPWYAVGLVTAQHSLLQTLLVHPPCTGSGGAWLLEYWPPGVTVSRGTRAVPRGPRQQPPSTAVSLGPTSQTRAWCGSGSLSRSDLSGTHLSGIAALLFLSLHTPPWPFPSVAQGPHRLCLHAGLLGALGQPRKGGLQPAVLSGQAGRNDEDTNVPGGPLPLSVSDLLGAMSVSSA